MKTDYIFGLDIGIGSVGWAVIAYNRETVHIENFGTNLFDPGEISNGRESKCQVRRSFRGPRRLIRRKALRKLRLKKYAAKIGLCDYESINEFCETGGAEVYSIKVKALNEKISPEELLMCLIHTCNHRGYKDFYSATYDVKSDSGNEIKDDEDDEEGKIREAIGNFNLVYSSGKYNTISECIIDNFRYLNNGIRFRNDNFSDKHYLIKRELVYEEAKKILESQKEYYDMLNEESIEMILKIMFSQRDFEDGPGDASDKYRRYTGFIDKIGMCPFYKDQIRGFRSTVIGDIFSVVNALSQYVYIDEVSGEYFISKEAAQEIIQSVLSNASANITKITKILKKYKITIKKSDVSDNKNLQKAIRFLSIAKKIIDVSDCTFDWETLINEPQFDINNPSRLHMISEVLAKYKTPSRRINELKKLKFLDNALIDKFSKVKLSGASSTSYAYMNDSINAFLNGESYGCFQARFIKNYQDNDNCEKFYKLPISCIDSDIKSNPVVFRAINESRKVINALIGVYGSPKHINVEVASGLNRSYLERKKIEKLQNDNEKKNDKIKEKIIDLLGDDTAATGANIEKYKLYEIQEGKCLYSGESLGDIKDVLTNRSGMYEIDHIVPYSLILDNTLENKALVFGSENQIKRQRTPLMYMDKNKADKFKATVNEMRQRKTNSISEKKYKYLMLETLYSEEAQNLLKEWKSRNINDTRYITKYIVGLLSKNLQFSGDSRLPVYGIKGSITSKFRRIWLNKDTWGADEKNRDSNLNHAADAVVIACLTPMWVEIASNNIKIRQMMRRTKGQLTEEVEKYVNSCVSYIKRYRGFYNETYLKDLLLGLNTVNNRIPSLVPNLSEEVDIRFNTTDKKKFDKDTKKYYGKEVEFIIPPYMPVVPHKQERKFRGEIADANSIKIREIDGKTFKIMRKSIKDLKKADMDKLYCTDGMLRDRLISIFEGKKDTYTIEQYLKDNNLKEFIMDGRPPVHKVSVTSTASNYYKVQKSEHNYSYLGMAKYYCTVIYKNNKGETDVWCVRYVDLIKKNKKLYVKADRVPKDYKEYVCYLIKNDYVKIVEKDGSTKIEGFYAGVKNINRHQIYLLDKTLNLINTTSENSKIEKVYTPGITKSDSVQKYSIDILGRIGGEIKCSEPFLFMTENI